LEEENKEREQEVEKPEEPQEKNKMNLMIPIAIVVIVLILVAVGYFLLKSRQNSNTEGMVQGESVTSESMDELPSSTDSMSEDSEAMSDAEVINVEGGLYYFKPNEITVKKGQRVKIVLTSVEGMHDFVLDEFNVKSSRVQAGQTTEVEFTPDKTGTFEFYCSVANHRALGMKGSLVVE
jgi:heme/copper-type cytochrome/quinol oxidase subunit 2